MTVTAQMIADVRLMVAEPTTDNYSDADIQAIIEKYPCLDDLGQEPYTWSGVIPVRVDNPNWVSTYDLNRAASDIWSHKAANVSSLFDFSADGGSYTRSQMHKHALSMARYYRAHARMDTFGLVKYPEETAPRNWIGNLPEED